MFPLVILTQHMFLLQSVSLIWKMCHSLILLLTTLLLLTVLQILIVMMRILLRQLHPLWRLHGFLDGSILLMNLLMTLLVILHISFRLILSSREPLPYWFKFKKIMILTHLQKPQAIQSGTQQWKNITIPY